MCSRCMSVRIQIISQCFLILGRHLDELESIPDLNVLGDHNRLCSNLAAHLQIYIEHCPYRKREHYPKIAAPDAQVRRRTRKRSPTLGIKLNLDSRLESWMLTAILLVAHPSIFARARSQACNATKIFIELI